MVAEHGREREGQDDAHQRGGGEGERDFQAQSHVKSLEFAEALSGILELGRLACRKANLDCKLCGVSLSVCG